MSTGADEFGTPYSQAEFPAELRKAGPSADGALADRYRKDPVFERVVTYMVQAMEEFGVRAMEDAVQVAKLKMRSEGRRDGPRREPVSPPWSTFKEATCRGSVALGTACGTCEKCVWEKSQ